MTETTTNGEVLSRKATADRLNDIASALRDGEQLTIRVGNKQVSLDPPSEVDYHIEVTEKQSRFRGSRETIELTLDWKPRSDDSITPPGVSRRRNRRSAQHSFVRVKLLLDCLFEAENFFLA
jgi:amphi-Trp domain-containing protein